MSDASSKAKIKETLRTMHEQWNGLKSEWRDSACEAMQREAVESADDAVRMAILALEQIGEAIARARQECGANES